VLTVSVQSANAWHFSRSRRGGPSATAPGDASSGLKTCSASSDAGSMINHAQAKLVYSLPQLLQKHMDTYPIIGYMW
jgi:hypothetical protein